MKLHRLLSIERSDVRQLTVLAPSFAVVAACTVVLASVSKALFLSTNPIQRLPWMFLGAAVITALSSLGYVSLMRAMRLEARFRLLLGLAVASLAALRLGFSVAPSAFGIVALLWCPTIGHLLVVQTWNVATSLLPTRRAKRMTPVLAAVTTAGAALGGIGVQLALRWLEAEDLFLLAGAALVLPLARVRAVVEGLGGETEASAPPPEAPEESEIMAGLRSIARRPLLTDLALLTFLLQAASLIVDYQFSAELKPRLDKDGIASFLGIYFWTSNLVVLALTLLATSRAIRAVGIGLALAASGVVLGVGSGVYFAAALSGMLPLFWVITATAFAERVASYAFTKPAMQMTTMPLQASGGERAKTILDGVVYRLATAAVSALLLVAAPELDTQFRLSLPALIACAVVLYIGVRMGPHYRRALFDALRARRLDAHLVDYLRNGLGRDATRDLERELKSTSAERVVRALEVAHELQVSPPVERLEALTDHDDPRVVRAALELMISLGHVPSPEVVAHVLAVDRPPELLRGILTLLTDHPTPALSAAVRPLVDHPDPAVASAACLFRIRAAGALASFDAEVEGQRATTRLTGMTLAGDFVRELPELLRHPEAQVRHDAIAQMGELRLRAFLPPLIACLDVADARAQARAALLRYGDRSVDAIVDHLDDDGLDTSPRIALLGLLERIASPLADDALLVAAGSAQAVVRDHAIEALWRRTLSAQPPSLDAAVLEARVAAEVDHLEELAALRANMESPAGPRGELFAAEIDRLLRAIERRIFRLLGFLYDRGALQRAYLHYRSPEARVRSNAIELLDQHVDGASGRRFVALVERGAEDAARAPSQIGTRNGAALRDPWLKRLELWAREAGDGPLDWTHPLDRWALLRRAELFAEVAGEPLMHLVGSMTRLELSPGQAVYRREDHEDDVYVVLDGAIELAPDDPVVVGRYASFGEVEALDGGPRCCDAIAVEPSVLVRVRRDDLDDAAIMFPAVLRGLVESLSRSLRARIS